MSQSAHTSFLAANEEYVARGGGQPPSLSAVPVKKLAIVTCMDARLNVFAQLGLKEGDAHIIRNAGGMARDAIRSIIISQRMLDTREIAVFRHTLCGMQTFTSAQLRERIREADPGNPALDVVNHTDFLEFTDLEASVKEDVQFLQNHPLVLPETTITGWVYEVETGRIRQIV
ncbi:carbonic anhydrase [Wolfiporia cocos MD-104 SS10]|uniref:Carbonic anhydrase n=1 Tax=Wolfiporia cocos (strain MD-104) TaxID=742152 RepID=A0A2H3JCV0_WOLCO|nr:carbonic anhydrase [Wolfiporia cocos MD-104 SS10]